MANNKQQPQQPKKSQQPKQSGSQSKGDPNRTLKIVLIVVGVLILLSVLAAAAIGFGVFKFGEQIAERASDSDIEVSDDGVSIENEEGSFKTETTLPEDFPSEVPLYENADLQSASSTKDKQRGSATYTVTYDTGDSVDQVSGFYKDRLNSNGWSTTSESTFNNLVSIRAEREDLTVSVTINPDEGTDNTRFTIVVNQGE